MRIVKHFIFGAGRGAGLINGEVATIRKMMDKPIIFNTTMVQALLAGRKTQTRRVVKAKSEVEGVTNKQSTIIAKEFRECAGRWFGIDQWDTKPCCYADCPYGQPGDLLWVRESFTECGDNFVAYRADNKIYQPINGALLAVNKKITYTPKWSPSIHMPRWASRLTLLVKDIRIERVQDISAKDVFLEGVQIPTSKTHYPLLELAGKYPPCNYIDAKTAESFYTGMAGEEIVDDLARAYFASLWDSINKQRGYGWGLNPWVWCLTFEVIHKNIDEVLQ